MFVLWVHTVLDYFCMEINKSDNPGLQGCDLWDDVLEVVYYAHPEKA